MFEEYLNKYCIITFNENNKVKKAKGVLVKVENSFVTLKDKDYGSVVLNLNQIIRISIEPKVVFNGKSDY
jgi:hypothetical protein